MRIATRTTKSPVTTVMAMATLRSMVHRSSKMPARKRIMASSRSAGINAIVASTFHDSQASMRIWRTKTFSRGAPRGEFHCMYSRNHCLAKMPKIAAARLRTRMMKKRQLIHRAAIREVDGEEAASGATVLLNAAAISVDVWESTAVKPAESSWFVVVGSKEGERRE